MTTVNKAAVFVKAFSFHLTEEGEGETKCKQWSDASKRNALYAALSYIPIVSLIAYTIFLIQERKMDFSQPKGKAFLARSILCMTQVLFPIVALLDIIGTCMKCHKRALMCFDDNGLPLDIFGGSMIDPRNFFPRNPPPGRGPGPGPVPRRNITPEQMQNARAISGMATQFINNPAFRAQLRQMPNGAEMEQRLRGALDQLNRAQGQ